MPESKDNRAEKIKQRNKRELENRLSRLSPKTAETVRTKDAIHSHEIGLKRIEALKESIVKNLTNPGTVPAVRLLLEGQLEALSAEAQQLEGMIQSLQGEISSKPSKSWLRKQRKREIRAAKDLEKEQKLVEKSRIKEENYIRDEQQREAKEQSRISREKERQAEKQARQESKQDSKLGSTDNEAVLPEQEAWGAWLEDVEQGSIGGNDRFTMRRDSAAGVVNPNVEPSDTLGDVGYVDATTIVDPPFGVTVTDASVVDDANSIVPVPLEDSKPYDVSTDARYVELLTQIQSMSRAETVHSDEFAQESAAEDLVVSPVDEFEVDLYAYPGGLPKEVSLDAESKESTGAEPRASKDALTAKVKKEKEEAKLAAQKAKDDAKAAKAKEEKERQVAAEAKEAAKLAAQKAKDDAKAAKAKEEKERQDLEAKERQAAAEAKEAAKLAAQKAKDDAKAAKAREEKERQELQEKERQAAAEAKEAAKLAAQKAKDDAKAEEIRLAAERKESADRERQALAAARKEARASKLLEKQKLKESADRERQAAAEAKEAAKLAAQKAKDAAKTESIRLIKERKETEKNSKIAKKLQRKTVRDLRKQERLRTRSLRRNTRKQRKEESKLQRYKAKHDKAEQTFLALEQQAKLLEDKITVASTQKNTFSLEDIPSTEDFLKKQQAEREAFAKEQEAAARKVLASLDTIEPGESVDDSDIGGEKYAELVAHETRLKAERDSAERLLAEARRQLSVEKRRSSAVAADAEQLRIRALELEAQSKITEGMATSATRKSQKRAAAEMRSVTRQLERAEQLQKELQEQERLELEILEQKVKAHEKALEETAREKKKEAALSKALAQESAKSELFMQTQEQELKIFQQEVNQTEEQRNLKAQQQAVQAELLSASAVREQAARKQASGNLIVDELREKVRIESAGIADARAAAEMRLLELRNIEKELSTKAAQLEQNRIAKDVAEKELQLKNYERQMEEQSARVKQERKAAKEAAKLAAQKAKDDAKAAKAKEEKERQELQEKERQAQREEKAAKAKEEKERQDLEAKERQAQRDAQITKAKLEKEAAAAAKEAAKLAAQKAKDDAKAAKRAQKTKASFTEVGTTIDVSDDRVADIAPPATPDQRVSGVSTVLVPDSANQKRHVVDDVNSQAVPVEVATTTKSQETPATDLKSPEKHTEYIDDFAAKQGHDDVTGIAKTDTHSDETTIAAAATVGEFVASTDETRMQADYTTPTKYIDMLLAPLIPADRPLVKEWLDTLDIEVLEKLSPLDVTKASLVLNNRKMVDDEEARNSYIVDLEALQKEIRARPAIEVVFKKTEYVVDDSDYEEQIVVEEKTVTETLTKSAKQLRKEEKARKKLAKEEAKLAATKEEIEQAKEKDKKNVNEVKPVETTRLVKDVTEERKPSLASRIKEKRIIKAATKETLKSLKKEQDLEDRAVKRASKLAESLSSNSVQEITQDTRKSKKFKKDTQEDQVVQAEEISPTSAGMIRDEVIVEKDTKKVTRVNDKKEAKLRKKQQAEDRAEAIKLEKARAREKKQENSMRVSQEKNLIAEQSAGTREQVKEVKRLEKERIKAEANEAKERAAQAKRDAAAAKEAEKRRRKQEILDTAERKAQEARDKVMNRESDKISKRASKINKTAGEKELIPIAGPQSSYGWDAESGGREAIAYSSDIDPLDFDIPEGLPVRNR